MSDDSESARIARLVEELAGLSAEERELAIEALSIEDRASVWEAELAANEAARPLGEDELGGEG